MPKWKIQIDGISSHHMETLKSLSDIKATVTQDQSDAKITVSIFEHITVKDGKARVTLSPSMRQLLTDNTEIELIIDDTK